MIVEFNPNLFDSNQDSILEAVSQVLILLSDKRHLCDVSSIREKVFNEDNVYVFDESYLSENFLSTYGRDRIFEFFKFVLEREAYITSFSRKYLRRIRVGTEEGEVHPALAIKILQEPSRIILENATNDWKFILGITEKYEKKKLLRSIYMQIRSAVQNHWIVAEQAGGKGQIKARVKDLTNNRYKDIHTYKLMALFDSDRGDPGVLDHEQKSIIEFLKGRTIIGYADAVFEEEDFIVWHMLYKREMENYVPLEILTIDPNIRPEQKEALSRLTPTQLDFLDFDAFLGSEEIDVKNYFPQLFLTEWTRDLLESRCEHHKIQIELANGTLQDASEIEEILLKIAKLV